LSAESRNQTGGSGGQEESRKQKAEVGLRDHESTDDGTGREESRNQKSENRNLLATEEEQAAIRAMLSKRAESAPAGARVGRASALAWAGFKLAAIVLLAAGVGVGYLDGDEFDDVGCTVAQQPGGTSHGARPAQGRERAGGKVPGSVGGSAGASGSGGPGGRPECEVRAAMCARRTPDGQCQRSNRQCALVKAEKLKAETLKGERGAAGKAERLKAETLKEEKGAGEAEAGNAETFPINLLKQVLDSTLEQQAAIERLLDGQALPEGQQRQPLAKETGQAALPEPSRPAEPSLRLAAKVFGLLTALDPDQHLRKAPPIKVFLLRFRRNRSLSEIARICRCDKSLVALRLKTLQEKLPWQPQQLRELSAHVEAMQDAVSDSRASSIYRKGAVCGGAEGGEGLD
jgi:hypothetical protein